MKILNHDRIIEPYSEHEDYLEQDNKSIKDVISTTSKNILNYGENLYKSYFNKKEESTTFSRDDNESAIHI